MWLGTAIGVLAGHDDKELGDILQRGLAVGIFYFIVGVIAMVPVVGGSLMGLFPTLPTLTTVMEAFMQQPMLGLFVAILAIPAGIIETVVGAFGFNFAKAIDKELG